jgi:LEA14-like dessication related protein
MRKTLFLSLSLVLVLCGCDILSSLSEIATSIKSPIVNMTSVDVAGVTSSGVDLGARGVVKNQNTFDLPMPKIDWKLFITGNSLAEGTKEDGRTVESGGKISLDIPIHLGYDKLLNAALAYIGSSSSIPRELPYTIEMGLTFTTIPALANKPFPLTRSGTIPLSSIPGLPF